MRGKRFYICFWLPLFLLSGFVTINVFPAISHDHGPGAGGGFAGLAAAYALIVSAPVMLLFTVLVFVPPRWRALKEHPGTAIASILTCALVAVLAYGLTTTKIEFEVIDQYGAPVPDATVQFHRVNRISTLWNPDRTTTGSDGKASLTYPASERIALSAFSHMEGYELPDPSHHTGRLEGAQPIAIPAWKLDNPAPLLVNRSRRAVYRQGNPGSYTFGYNFAENAINHTGYERSDVIVTINNAGAKNSPRDRSWDWGVRLDFQGAGGIQPSHDTFSYAAPADGYQKQKSFDYPAAMGRGWRQQLRGESTVYYFRTRDGKYGTLRLRASAYKTGRMYVQFDNVSLNEAGGRNLTYAPGSSRVRHADKLKVIP